MYLYFYYVHWTQNYVKQSFYLYKATGQMFFFNIIINSKGSLSFRIAKKRNLKVNLNLSKCLLLSQLLGVYLGVEFQTQPIMNIKRNIILALENRKKNVCQSQRTYLYPYVCHLCQPRPSLQRATGLTEPNEMQTSNG